MNQPPKCRALPVNLLPVVTFLTPEWDLMESFPFTYFGLLSFARKKPSKRKWRLVTYSKASLSNFIIEVI